MSEQVKKITKRGRWIYGGTAPSEVWIVMQNYFEGPTIPDEELIPGYPPCDENGMFYYAAYAQQGKIRSVSKCCGSQHEAVRLAESTIQGQITWE
jgi:hypothetical protein